MKTNIWRRYLVCMGLVAFLGPAGCAVVMKDKQSMFFEFGTRVELGTENSKTHGEESYMKITVDDRIMPAGKAKAEEPDGG